MHRRKCRKNLKVLDINLNEAQLTDSALVRFGVPQERILLLQKGTSTLEEASVIRDFCLKKGQLRASVISDKFHSGRAKALITPVLKKEGIKLTMLGSPSSSYNEDRWWESESGLIMVNNEYAKKLYYLLN
ncbi:MAG: YdcF family protein [Sphingobacteriales bacterium JAD_PAG50586_3]|nr:MAG: YdcF family protein [Sphingobacteriales bacterium JAD_PAG50586_3]